MCLSVEIHTLGRGLYNYITYISFMFHVYCFFFFFEVFIYSSNPSGKQVIIEKMVKRRIKRVKPGLSMLSRLGRDSYISELV